MRERYAAATPSPARGRRACPGLDPGWPDELGSDEGARHWGNAAGISLRPASRPERHRPASYPAPQGHLLPQAGEGKSRALPRLALVAALALATAACDPRDCALGIANGDCYPRGSALAAFPQDDAICRNYGLAPGTHDYLVCRQTKHHERALTERETDYGFLQDPLTPNVR